MVFIFLAYFTLYNGLQFHPSHENWLDAWDKLSDLVHWEDLEGLGGEGGGRGDRDGEHM